MHELKAENQELEEQLETIEKEHGRSTPQRQAAIPLPTNPPPRNFSATESDLLALGESTRQRIKDTQENHSEDVDAHLALAAQSSKAHAEKMAKLAAEHELMLEAQANGKFWG